MLAIILFNCIYFIVSKVYELLLAYYLLIPSTKGYDENNLFTYIKLIRPSE